MKYILLLLFSAVFLLSSCGSRTPENVRSVPILMYHDFTTGSPSAYAVTLERFDEHLTALENAGYRAVTFDDLINYVYFGGGLPENPVLITSDDGYAGVLTLAADCAARHSMPLSCAVIGSLSGVNGHFSFKEPIPDNMEIVSHTFALHDRAGWTGMVCPEADLWQYEQILAEDCAKMNEVCREAFPHTSSVLVYPHGAYSAESERILHKLGYVVTVTCDVGTAEIRQGEPESLYTLPRLSVWQNMTGKQLLEIIESHQK